MNVPDYKNYVLSDFLADRNFKSWVKTPTSESDLFWGEFNFNFPQKKTLVQEARLIIFAATAQCTANSSPLGPPQSSQSLGQRPWPPAAPPAAARP